MKDRISGTLAIDLGNTNSVLAFQAEKDLVSILIEIPGITTHPGVVPTAVWFDKESEIAKIGLSAIKMREKQNSDIFYHSNFKRLIGNNLEKHNTKTLSPTESGEKFFNTLWENIPKKYNIKRLVLTAPIDTYKGYRQWLINLCKELPVEEVALVDEPTAAGLGIDIPFGSKIMTIDIGGSTIDMNIIQLEGGEGKSAPIAELLKFKGNNVSSVSKQKIKCAKIISKSGSKIGGKDLDQWIVNHYIPSNLDQRNLLAAEEVKCKLSLSNIKKERIYPLKFFVDDNRQEEFLISKETFEEIVIKNNFLKHLNSLMKELLNEARGNFCNLDDLNSVILVGGGTQIPLVKEWLLDLMPGKQFKTPPAIEAVALGALAMTPGVKIKDILRKSLSIRLLNRRDNKHFWHPIFCKGQTWPTEKPFELILQASKNGQNIFEIVIGETKKEMAFDVIFENGLPKLAEIQSEEETIKWGVKPLKITLKNNCKVGEDCLKLFFRINEQADFCLKCFCLNGNELGEFKLGNIF